MPVVALLSLVEEQSTAKHVGTPLVGLDGVELEGAEECREHLDVVHRPLCFNHGVNEARRGLAEIVPGQLRIGYDRSSSGRNAMSGLPTDGVSGASHNVDVVKTGSRRVGAKLVEASVGEMPKCYPLGIVEFLPNSWRESG